MNVARVLTSGMATRPYNSLNLVNDNPTLSNNVWVPASNHSKYRGKKTTSAASQSPQAIRIVCRLVNLERFSIILSMKRPSPFLIALVLASTGFAIAIGAQTTAAPADASGAQTTAAPADASGVAPEPHTFPDAPGKDVVQMACGACHSPDYVTDAPRNAQGWTDVLDMMKAYGATATDAEWDQIKGYLLGHIATIEVNKATAAELQALFEVDEPLAKAIVDYRTANGNFKTIDDVKTVPGLDAKKVDYRKNRLEF